MTKLRIVDSGLRGARENLALTEALCRLHRAGAVAETLRFQRFPASAIIGRHQVLAREVDLAYCAARGIGTARRMTGGGAIVMGPGILGWELIASRRHLPQDLGAVSGVICTAVAAGLRGLGVAAAYRPRNDVEVEGRKICGTGGYFDGDTLVFQGTVLAELDLALLMGALRLPAGKLGKRGLESVRDRVCDLKSLRGRGAPGEIEAALAEAMALALGARAEAGAVTAAEEALAAEVLAAEIGQDAFVAGQDDALGGGGALRCHRLALPGGEIVVTLKPRQGLVDQVLITGDFFVTPPRVIADLEAHLRGCPLEAMAEVAAQFLAAQGAGFLGLGAADMVAAIAAAGDIAMSQPNRLLIILVNTDPRNGEELGAPFYHAAVAAALGYTVDVVCTATAGRLLKIGVAAGLEVKPGSGKSVYEFIRDAHRNGARFYACPANLDLFDMKAEDLIPECAGFLSTAQMITDLMEGECRVLTY